MSPPTPRHHTTTRRRARDVAADDGARARDGDENLPSMPARGRASERARARAGDDDDSNLDGRGTKRREVGIETSRGRREREWTRTRTTERGCGGMGRDERWTIGAIAIEDVR